MSIPVGYALGYIYGGLVGYAFGWRAAFVSEALLMLPFVVFAFRTEPIPLRKASSQSADLTTDDDASEALLHSGLAEALPRPSEMITDLKILARCAGQSCLRVL